MTTMIPWDWDDPERIERDSTTPWIETLKPFSDSVLWKLQYDFYSQTDASAWDTVPFFLTSNPLLADIYVTAVLGWLSDHIDKIDLNEPVYILELGAGLARFGFHMIKTLQRKRPFFPKLSNIQFCYVLTDCSEAQVASWQNNPLFQGWIKTGLLDMGVFLPDQHTEVYLTQRQATLNAASLKNPLIAMANYFYDSIPHDFFVTRSDGLDEVRLSVYSTSNEAPSKPGVHHIGLALSRNPVQSAYYNIPEWNELLAYYTHHCRPNTEISIPIGSFHVLKNLLTLSQGRLMLLSADKAIDAPSFMSLRHPDSTRSVASPFNLVMHNGAFSTDVNYHATTHLTTQLGGQAFNTSLLNAPLHLQFNVFLQGTLPSVTSNPFLNYYVNEVLNTQNPIASLANRMAMLDDWECSTPQQFITALKCLFQLICDSHYDPYLLKRYNNLLTDLPDLNDHIAAQVEDLLDKCRDNVFNIPLSDNVYSIIGILYRCCGVPDKAISALMEGIDRFGESALICNLLSLCHSDLRHYSNALLWAEKALTYINPTDENLIQIQAIQSRVAMWQELLATQTTV